MEALVLLLLLVLAVVVPAGVHVDDARRFQDERSGAPPLGVFLGRGRSYWELVEGGLAPPSDLEGARYSRSYLLACYFDVGTRVRRSIFVLAVLYNTANLTPFCTFD